MNKKFLVNCFRVVLVSGIICSVSLPNAFAGQPHGSGRHGGFHGSPRHEVVVVRGSRYNFDHDHGKFFSSWLFGFIPVPVPAPIGAIVASLPIGHTTIVIGGARYYHYDRVYYADYPTGYIVVSDPTVRVVSTAAPQVMPAVVSEEIAVNIPNSNGSYTVVKLRRKDNGYIGPQGEFYPSHPTVEQLKLLYGN